MKKKIALRIDDIGASTKKYEIYSKKFLGNILFLKYTELFKNIKTRYFINSGNKN